MSPKTKCWEEPSWVTEAGTLPPRRDEPWAPQANPSHFLESLFSRSECGSGRPHHSLPVLPKPLCPQQASEPYFLHCPENCLRFGICLLLGCCLHSGLLGPDPFPPTLTGLSQTSIVQPGCAGSSPPGPKGPDENGQHWGTWGLFPPGFGPI